MKKQIPAWLVLGIIMMVAALSLAGTNMITRDTIAKQQVLNDENARKAVLAEAESFEQLPLEEGAAVDDLFAAKKGDEVIGHVGVTTVKGYGGPIKIIAGLSNDGTITGINVGGASFAETAGLGAKAKEADFTNRFEGKRAPVKVIKAGEAQSESTVDAITAATITSSAVARGVNTIAKQITESLAPAADAAQGFAGGNAKAASDGFAGPVAVDVTFDADGTITALTIGDDKFEETDGLGAEALKPEFAQQFIGRKAPLKLSDIDAISGATITSEAVVTAINKAMEQLSAPAATAFAGGNAKAASDGFAGPVAVDVTFDADGTITALTIGDDKFEETDGLGAEALKPEFAQQFIGRKAPLKLSDIDAISGATITSEAVITAINEAMEQLSGQPAARTETVEEKKPAADVPAAAEEAAKVEGITVSKDGFAGPVAVTVKFADDNATIEALAIGDDKFEETDGLGAEALKPEFAQQFIGRKAPLKLSDIDAISGATITSEAVVDAINEAQKQAAPANDAQDTAGAVKRQAVGKGFAGEVPVEVSFDKDGVITAFRITDGTFADAASYGKAVLEEGFAQQLIGKKAPLKAEDVDAVSFATKTVEAVVEAINAAYAQK